MPRAIRAPLPQGSGSQVRVHGRVPVQTGSAVPSPAILQLQRTIGNRAVQRLLAGSSSLQRFSSDTEYEPESAASMSESTSLSSEPRWEPTTLDDLVPPSPAEQDGTSSAFKEKRSGIEDDFDRPLLFGEDDNMAGNIPSQAAGMWDQSF